MENRKLLIVGIDPGITTGFAVLDIEGNFLHLDSSKQLDLNLLISETISLGRAVLVGTDKAKAPNLVESFATKVGAVVISPEEDLRVDEKSRMTSDYNFDDEHQGDALASALLAYRRARALLEKIDVFAKENKKQGITNKIKEIVITKKLSIKNAVSIIEKKDEESLIMEKAIVERRLNENDFLKLYEKLKKYENEIKLVKKYNSSLRSTIASLERQIRVKKPPEIQKTDFKENKIRFLENSIKLKEREIWLLKFSAKKLRNGISNLNNICILKKLDTLGINELRFKDRILNIQPNDILLVDNPNIVSSNAVEFLRNKVFVIAYKKPISRKIDDKLPFIFISASNLEIEEDKYFGFADKKLFELEKGKTGWVRKIVEAYKKEKEQLA